MGGFLFGVLIEDSNAAATTRSAQKHRSAVFLADAAERKTAYEARSARRRV
jgi:hypothetical protein